MKDVSETQTAEDKEFWAEIAALYPSWNRSFDKFEMDKEIVLENVAELPAKINERQLEEFIETLRIRYGIRAAEQETEDGAPIHTPEQIAASFGISLD